MISLGGFPLTGISRFMLKLKTINQFSETRQGDVLDRPKILSGSPLFSQLGLSLPLLLTGLFCSLTWSLAWTKLPPGFSPRLFFYKAFTVPSLLKAFKSRHLVVIVVTVYECDHNYF